LYNDVGSKKVWQKGCCKGLAKKTLASVDLHCQSSINSKMKLNEAILYQTIKQTPYFAGFVLCHERVGLIIDIMI